MANVAVLGCGSWGLTLARLLSRRGLDVRAWEFDPSVAEQLKKKRCLETKLPGVRIPDSVMLSTDLGEVVDGREVIVFAVPSQTTRLTCESLKKASRVEPEILVSASKGLERGTLLTMREVIEEVLQPAEPGSIVALSGPSHAEEVSRDIPTSVVVAGPSDEINRRAQALFMTERFRVYTNDDPHGVELAAALKNVIAIAAGISDGLGFGDNAKAALISRGLSELIRLGTQTGAKPYTFTGLAGLGDLVATCTSKHSRNRNFGVLIGKGIPQQEALTRIGMVVEGVETARSVLKLQERYEVDEPISAEVYRVLFEGKSPAKAVPDLMLREAKPELERDVFE